MNKEDLKKFICDEHTSIVDAMSKIDSNGQYIVFSVDDEGRLTGSVTDGDIRRWIIKTGTVDADISGIVFRNTGYVQQQLSEAASEAEAFSLYGHTDKRVIPVVNENHGVVDIVILKQRKSEIYSNSLEDIPVIIMAGGKGTRLYPYTKILPKPLIPVGETPIMERIIGRFCDYGAKKIYITVNYKKEMIKSYLCSDSAKYDLLISFL